MHPLQRAILATGKKEFTRAELVGVLSFRLRIMSPSEAKRNIEKWVIEGVLEEVEEKLSVVEEVLKKEEESKDLLGEMVEYLSKKLEMTELEVMEEIKKLKRRYGDIDDKLLAYLFGMDRGIDMSPFQDMLMD